MAHLPKSYYFDWSENLPFGLKPDSTGPSGLRVFVLVVELSGIFLLGILTHQYDLPTSISTPLPTPNPLAYTKLTMGYQAIHVY